MSCEYSNAISNREVKGLPCIEGANLVHLHLHQIKIPKRETLGPVELVFKNKGRNYGHFERVKVEKRDKN